MPAANTVTMVGYIVGTPEPSNDNKPGKFRLNTYCSGSKAKDNIKRAFINVKTFDNDAIRALDTDEQVMVVGRFDPWSPKDDPKRQVLDVFVETFDGTEHCICNVDRDGNPIAGKAPSDEYDDEEY